MVSDSELEALSTLRGLRGAPRVPPVNCRAIFLSEAFPLWLCEVFMCHIITMVSDSEL